MSGARPRVLFVTDQVTPGGKRSHVEALQAGLDDAGWDARRFDWASLGWLERAAVAGPHRALEVVRRGLGHRWILPSLGAVFARRLRQWSENWKPDVWHAQEFSTYPAVRSSAGGRPVALTVHGPAHREIASAYGRRLEDPLIRWLRDLEAAAIVGADAVVSVDRAHADYARGLGRTGPIWVIPNFVDTRRFHPGPRPALDPGLEAWIAGRPLLLCTRRFVPKNGVEIAIRAAHELAARGCSFAMLLAGSGPLRDSIEAMRARLGLESRVRLVGDVAPDAMPDWVRRADIVLVPSIPSGGIEEATSISALEAQACGRPVVVSRLGGLREIVEDERTGLMIPPGDVAALGAQIRRLFDDPRLAETLGRQAAEQVRERHSHVAGARAYAEVYAALGVRGPGAGG